MYRKKRRTTRDVCANMPPRYCQYTDAELMRKRAIYPNGHNMLGLEDSTFATVIRQKPRGSTALAQSNQCQFVPPKFKEDIEEDHMYLVQDYSSSYSFWNR